jgi:hypothetical protein
MVISEDDTTALFETLRQMRHDIELLTSYTERLLDASVERDNRAIDAEIIFHLRHVDMLEIDLIKVVTDCLQGFSPDDVIQRITCMMADGRIQIAHPGPPPLLSFDRLNKRPDSP